MRVRLKNLLTGEEIEATATTEHPTSSYGQPVWVDENNVSYGQCRIMGQYAVEPGYVLLEVRENG